MRHKPTPVPDAIWFHKSGNNQMLGGGTLLLHSGQARYRVAKGGETKVQNPKPNTTLPITVGTKTGNWKVTIFYGSTRQVLEKSGAKLGVIADIQYSDMKLLRTDASKSVVPYPASQKPDARMRVTKNITWVIIGAYADVLIFILNFCGKACVYTRVMVSFLSSLSNPSLC